MADPISSFSVGQVAANTTSAISQFVWPAVFTLLGVVIIAFLLWYLSFRHKVRIRILTSQGSVPFDDKAREVMEDGVRFWKLQKRKDIIPIPPQKCLTSLGKSWDGKPKFYGEMYWSEEYGYIYIQDDVSKENVKDKITIVKDRLGSKQETRDTFKPFTPQQRALLVNQLRKAQERKKKSLLDQITALAVPIMFVMILFSILIFWEDIAQPSKDMATLSVQMMEQQKELLTQQADISAQNARMVQVLGGQIPASQLQIQQNLPPGGG